MDILLLGSNEAQRQMVTGRHGEWEAADEDGSMGELSRHLSNTHSFITTVVAGWVGDGPLPNVTLMPVIGE